MLITWFTIKCEECRINIKWNIAEEPATVKTIESAFSVECLRCSHVNICQNMGQIKVARSWRSPQP